MKATRRRVLSAVSTGLLALLASSEGVAEETGDERQREWHIGDILTVTEEKRSDRVVYAAGDSLRVRRYGADDRQHFEVDLNCSIHGPSKHIQLIASTLEVTISNSDHGLDRNLSADIDVDLLKHEP